MSAEGIGIGVIGAGHWGPNLIANFHESSRSRVHWVVDRDATRLAAVAERFPGVRTGQDVAELLADSEVDAVVIATPTRSHAELVSAAIAAGKDVLVEKPLADSLDDARRVAREAEESGRILLVGHVFLFNEAAREARRCLQAGELGRVYFISMVRTNLGPIRVDVNAAWDLAAHDISLASYWLDAEPESVSAIGGAWINPGIEDAVFATLRYPGDVLVNLHASWLNPRKARDITIVGDQRMLTFDDVNFSEPLRIYDKQVGDERRAAPLVDSLATFRMSVLDGNVRIPEVAASQPLMNECEHFLDCVIERRQPLSDGARGVAVVRALTGLTRSLQERREVLLSEFDEPRVVTPR